MKLAPVNWTANTLNELYNSYMSEEDHSSWYLDELSNLASLDGVNTITEFGIFQGHSITAFLRGNPKKIIGYDIETDKIEYDVLKKFAQEKNIELQIHNGNCLNINIEETDLLFLDSIHYYEHVQKELDLHASKVKKYIVVHDVNYPYDKQVLVWRYVSDGSKRPTSELIPATAKYRKVRQAVEEFIKQNKQWNLYKDINEKSGMMILCRK